MTDKEFQYVLDWLYQERTYQTEKFDYKEQDDTHTREFDLNKSEIEFDLIFWNRQLYTYLYRAWILGLDTPGGRQALAKFAATAVAFTESTVRVFGPLPQPGVSSGENLDNLCPL